MTEAQPDLRRTEIAVPDGLSWSWHLDVETLLVALSEPAPWSRPPSVAAGPPAPTASPGTGRAVAGPADTGPADTGPAGPEASGAGSCGPESAVAASPGVQLADPVSGGEADPVEVEFADYLDALNEGRAWAVPLSVAAGRVAEILPPGPDLAAWLAGNPVGNLEDGALAGAAAAYRRLAAWAQAGELAVVALMASRSAAADKRQGVDENGRPCRVTADACAQVSLALTMSQSAAQWWTDLAVTLRWRLAATGTALRDGVIDLPRAKVIAEGTAPLDEEQAKAVEARILPKAGDQTTAQLRASLRRAVITADPDGADRRREEAEKRAKVTLYPDADGTASLAGQNLPSDRAAAAMARVTALARALKASGATGGIGLLRSKVYLGLLLGTLPLIPPPPEGPADTDCPPSAGPAGSSPAADDASNPLLEDWPWNSDRSPGKNPSPGKNKASAGQDTADPCNSPGLGSPQDPDSPGGTDSPADEDWPAEDKCQPGGDWPAYEADDPPCMDPQARPVPWPEATPFLPSGPAALKNLPPAGSGFLDLRIPWITLARGGPEPGYLTRQGPITPAQASYLALLAGRDTSVEWRVVLTGDTGRAIAVTRVRRRRSSVGAARADLGDRCSLLRRVTVVMSAGEPGSAAGIGLSIDPNLAGVLAAILTAAEHAAGQAAERATADVAAGGCAHAKASLAYEVPTRLREFVNLRDLTCRFPTCRQPAWRCDCDHTRPFDQGGPTCCCNLGALCRYHHQVKQLDGWRLDQPSPGTFTWTTPTGRTYTIQPDLQAA
jgi:hypothetical protein